MINLELSIITIIENCLTKQFVGVHVANSDSDMLTRFSTNLKSLVCEGTIEQILLVKGCGGLYTVDLAHQLLNFRLDIRTVYRSKSSVLTLYSQLIDTL